jgi:hypothetical protein
MTLSIKDQLTRSLSRGAGAVRLFVLFSGLVLSAHATAEVTLENSVQNVITNPIPENTEYLDDTAFGSGTVIVYSLDGEAFAAPEALTVMDQGVEVSASAKEYRAIRWIFEPELKPGESSHVSFNVRLK